MLKRRWVEALSERFTERIIELHEHIEIVKSKGKGNHHLDVFRKTLSINTLLLKKVNPMAHKELGLKLGYI